jgi:NAD(P)-dependent dehydrogenase (short-subunit alcohol dehydrogenase family)
MVSSSKDFCFLEEIFMNVLVTGGAGYIGSHTCKALAQAGVTPVVYDDLSAGHEWSVKWGPLVIGDLGDRTLLQLTIRKYDIQAVFHLAGRAYSLGCRHFSCILSLRKLMHAACMHAPKRAVNDTVGRFVRVPGM